MASITVGNNIIAVIKDLYIDCYDYSNHKIIVVESNDNNDRISDIIISYNCKYLAVITSTSKQLIVYELPLLTKKKQYILPRTGSKIRFSARGDRIFVADKSGDVLMYDITKEDDGIKLLGHLSLLLNILQTNNCKFIISSDRDEKIRVSCFPNTYNIQTYCLGHREFVNHIELLPHDDNYLTSTSGDGTIKFWDYTEGKLYYSIDTFLDVNDEKLKENFAKVMIEDGIEVNTLPIVHYAITKLNDSCSILAAAVHTFNQILIYSVHTRNQCFEHKLHEKLDVQQFPASFKFYNNSLFVYNAVDSYVEIFKIKYEKLSISLHIGEKVQMFINNKLNTNINLENNHTIKLLYKRKFDNVQEYQERKRQRLGKV